MDLETMILDAKRLANRLKEKEILADSLILDTERLNDQVESMKQFQDDLNALNKIAREKSNSEMINQINQENPQIREIQAENRQLKAAIEEHQRVIEMIMSKFAENLFDKLDQTKIDFTSLAKKYDHGCVKIINKQAEKIQEMATVMQTAIKAEEDECNKVDEILSRLQTENKGLREILGITNSMNSMVINQEKTEKSTQTETESNPTSPESQPATEPSQSIVEIESSQ